MSHITDPMMSLKQIYPNTLALTNETFNYNEENNAIEISEKMTCQSSKCFINI